MQMRYFIRCRLRTRVFPSTRSRYIMRMVPEFVTMLSYTRWVLAKT